MQQLKIDEADDICSCGHWRMMHKYFFQGTSNIEFQICKALDYDNSRCSCVNFILKESKGKK